MKRFVLAAAAAAVLAVPFSANAMIWTSKLEYQGDLVTPDSPIYGTVQVEDGFNGGTAVKVTVTLQNSNSLFINTGGPHDPFLYNVNDAATVNIVNSATQNFFDGGHTDVGSFEATPFGTFTNKVGCCSEWIDAQDVVSGFHYENQTTTEQVLVGYQILGYEQKVDKKGNLVFDKKTGAPVYDTDKPIYDYSKPIYQTKTTTTRVKILEYTHIAGHWVEHNGASNGIKGPLVFYLTDNAGISFAGNNPLVDTTTGKLLSLGTGNHFFSNTAGAWFSADIYDANTGKTYNVAAKDAFTTIEQHCITCQAVPEPATWTMMIGGFGAMGAILRRRRSLMAL